VARTGAFLIGIALLVWATCGFPQVYARSLYWVWTTQTLALLLAIPVVLMAGRPLELAQRSPNPHTLAERTMRSRPAQALRNPLVGPMAVVVLTVVLFFGPLPGWAAALPPLGWMLQLVLVAVGALIVLPLVSGAEVGASLMVGVALAVGVVELVLDAIPGIVLRLETHTATSYFTHRLAHPWSPSALHDQQLAGAILWCVAELIDLPFLALVFLLWVHADRAEAAQVDAVLDAERAGRAALSETASPAETDAPWWLSDPALRNRFRH
jgi:cytochrome c oxidase assembly factor CtaG